MNKTIHIIIISTLLLTMPTLAQSSKTKSDGSTSLADMSVIKNTLKAEAIAIVKKFGGSLKPKLKGAMKKGGPIEAIKVCSVEAPSIAEKLSEESGWNVKRVSLKARHKELSTPDAWEEQVLKEFDKRQTAGESAEKMAFAEIVDGKFRFMKAQGVAPLCLACHGESIDKAVQDELKLHYPHDMAKGYKLGQIRGAFSLSKDL